MKAEFIIFLATLFIILNIYYDNKLMYKIYNYKKYYKMIFVAFVGLSLYLLLKKNPKQAKDLLYNVNTYVKYAPIDKKTESFITPIINLTQKSVQNVPDNYNYNNNNNNFNNNNFNNNNFNNNNLNNNNFNNNNLNNNNYNNNNNQKKTKRSVSETKKKYIASNQNWKCNHCYTQLNAWFEVDHIQKLGHGGTNDVNNLEALCRECHGKKTAFENL
tara:strand:+ start:13342 stop:13989 length:648 start_codon:yes stop_codon:yes gene_type:complete